LWRGRGDGQACGRLEVDPWEGQGLAEVGGHRDELRPDAGGRGHAVTSSRAGTSVASSMMQCLQNGPSELSRTRSAITSAMLAAVHVA
jgi:hypothetical protein